MYLCKKGRTWKKITSFDVFHIYTNVLNHFVPLGMQKPWGREIPIVLFCGPEVNGVSSISVYSDTGTRVGWEEGTVPEKLQALRGWLRGCRRRQGRPLRLRIVESTLLKSPVDFYVQKTFYNNIWKGYCVNFI